MVKKISTLFLVLSLLLPQFAAAEDYPELLKNTGFETVTDGILDNWGGLQRDWGENSSVSVSSEKKNSGNNALKIVNGDDASPWANQQISGLISGATYTLSFWLYAELGKSAERGAGAKLEFYKGASASSGGVGSKSILYYGSTNGRWTYVSQQFVLPQEATMVKLYLRLYSDGYAYFDDVSLKLADVEKFTYSTSHVFHYTDDETGTASVRIHDYYLSGDLPENSRANFYIYDGETEVAKKLNVAFADGTASYTYSVPDILQKKGIAYRLRMDAVDTDGTVLDTFFQNLYTYDRPKFLDKDGIYRDETGKIVNPVIAYHLNREDYAKAREAGFTMFQIGYGSAPVANEEQRNNVLNSAKENGLKGLFSLYLGMKAACHPDNIENTKKIVEMYKDDPRIFGWLVQDEPLGGGITEEKKEWLEISYKTIRDIDPNHPIILTDYSSYVFKETVKYCDVFIPNSYGMSYSGVRNYVEESVKYAQGRPVYPNVGAHARGTGTEAEMPTGDQLQHFMYQAFMGGAKGVSMYSFSDVYTKPQKTQIYKTHLWEPLCDIGQTELPVLFDLFVHGKETPEKIEKSKYSMRKWTREDEEYYCITSLSDNVQTITLPVGENRGVQLLGGDSTEYFTLSDDTLTVSLAGGDVLLLKMSDMEKCVQITQNGIGIKKPEPGQMTVLGPEGTERIAVAYYETVNGTEKLVRVEMGMGNSLSTFVLESDLPYTMKAYAWKDTLSPVVKFASIGRYGN